MTGKPLAQPQPSQVKASLGGSIWNAKHMHSFISQISLNPCCVPGRVLGNGAPGGTNGKQVLSSLRLQSGQREQINPMILHKNETLKL